jgi:hypothetical protein
VRDGLGNPVTTYKGEYVYKLVNLLGDGQFATEHYSDNRPSIYNNGSVKIDNEIPNEDIINYYTGVVKAEKEVVPSQRITPIKQVAAPITKSVKILSDDDVAAYASYLQKSEGMFPKEFFTAATRFKEFYNPATGKREKAPQTSKWLLQNGGLYDLVDKDSGEIYITGVDLRTGMKMITEQAPKAQVVIEEKPVEEKDIDKDIKDIITKSGLEENEVKVIEINGKKRVINLLLVPSKLKRGYSKFYSATSSDVFFERYGKKIVVSGFEDVNLMIEQDTNNVFELSTGLLIDTQSSTQKMIKEELETILKEKDIRAALLRTKKTDINSAIISTTYATFEDSFSPERQKEIVTNFATKHKYSEQETIDYIKNAIATKGQEVIDKLNECY